MVYSAHTCTQRYLHLLEQARAEGRVRTLTPSRRPRRGRRSNIERMAEYVANGTITAEAAVALGYAKSVELLRAQVARAKLQQLNRSWAATDSTMELPSAGM